MSHIVVGHFGDRPLWSPQGATEWTVVGMDAEKFDAVVGYLNGDCARSGLAHLKRDAERYVLPQQVEGDDGMYLLNAETGLKVYPRNVIRTIIARVHSTQGHLTRDPLHRLMRTQMFIKVGKRLIMDVLLKCNICHSSKNGKKKAKPLIPLPVESGIFSRIQIDLINLVGQPSSLGHTFIMVIIDCFTKYVWTYPMLSKTADQCTFLINNWITEWGLPKIIQTDNGREFTNKDVTALLEDSEATVVHGRPSHPQTQGKVEAANKTLETILLKMTLEDGTDDWIFYLDNATAVYNNKIHTSTKLTPFEALIGQPKRLISGSPGNPSKRKARVGPPDAEVMERYRKRNS